MNTDELTNTQDLLEIHRKNLSMLEIQAAKNGINVPINILNEIDNEQKHIRILEQKLQEIETETHENTTIKFIDLPNSDDFDITLVIKDKEPMLPANMNRLMLANHANATKPSIESTPNKSKTTRILSAIAERLESINRDIINTSRALQEANERTSPVILQILSIIPVSSRLNNINRSYKLLVSFCDKNRLYIPDDVNLLIEVYKETFFPNNAFRYIFTTDYNESQNVSSQLQKQIQDIHTVMRKYIE